MDVQFECAECGQRMEAASEGSGFTTACPGCGKPVTVPRVAQRPALPTPWKVALLCIGSLVSVPLIITPALAEDFKTLNGKEYKDATIARVEPDGVVLKYKSGISKVYFTELSKEVQQRFHYDAAKAANLVTAEHTKTEEDYAPEAREKLKPWVDDNAVTPPQLRGAEFSPSYAETLEFINHKLQLGRRMWFGERSQKMILVLPRMNEAVIFDPAACDPRVKYVTRSGQYPDSYIEIESSNGKDGVQVFNAFFRPEKSDKFFLHFGQDMDSLDLEKVAKAFRHLIEMFGGTPGNF